MHQGAIGCGSDHVGLVLGGPFALSKGIEDVMSDGASSVSSLRVGSSALCAGIQTQVRLTGAELAMRDTNTRWITRAHFSSPAPEILRS